MVLEPATSLDLMTFSDPFSQAFGHIGLRPHNNNKSLREGEREIGTDIKINFYPSSFVLMKRGLPHFPPSIFTVEPL